MLSRPTDRLDPFVHDVQTISKIAAVQRILDVAQQTTGLGFCVVARVTATRWAACAVRDRINFGLKPGDELDVKTTLCDIIRASGQPIVIDHVATDAKYQNHPCPQAYGFQSYIAVPINLPDGSFLGTLCGIDPDPAKLNTPEVVGMFTLFADLIAQHFDAQRRIEASESALLNAHAAAQLREQFIAVLGHDLRNPLGAVDGAAELLGMTLRDDASAHLIALIRRSTSRMSGLISDLLDLARGRLGGGLPLNRTHDTSIDAAIEHVIHELQTAHPHREIRRDGKLTRRVRCDRARIAQMLSNLLANALTHGSSVGPIWVKACDDGDCFEISVANPGQPIPEAIIANLFQPFSRGSAKPGQQGLGLGLYIASEIAKAHGGALSVMSVPGETRFTFRMPLDGELN